MSRIKDWDMMYKTNEYRRCWDYKTHSPELAAIVASGIIPDGAAVLDVGCGSGSDAMFLASMGFVASGIDLSEEALKIARKRSEQLKLEVEWKVGDALNIPFSDRSFDFVNDRGCFHHIIEDQRAHYACEIGRVLRESGVLLLVGSRKAHMFIPVDEASVRETFADRFEYRRLVPMTMVSDSIQLDANMVILKKKDCG